MFSPVVCFVPRSIPQVFEFHLSGRTIRAHCRIAPGGHGAVSLLLDDEEQIEDALPEPEQEGALESPVGETVPCDPGIGGLGPLPDARPDEVEVIEGVRSKAKGQLRAGFDLGLAYGRAEFRADHPITNAVDSAPLSVHVGALLAWGYLPARTAAEILLLISEG